MLNKEHEHCTVLKRFKKEREMLYRIHRFHILKMLDLSNYYIKKKHPDMIVAEYKVVFPFLFDYLLTEHVNYYQKKNFHKYHLPHEKKEKTREAVFSQTVSNADEDTFNDSPEPFMLKLQVAKTFLDTGKYPVEEVAQALDLKAKTLQAAFGNEKWKKSNVKLPKTAPKKRKTAMSSNNSGRAKTSRGTKMMKKIKIYKNESTLDKKSLGEDSKNEKNGEQSNSGTWILTPIEVPKDVGQENQQELKNSQKYCLRKRKDNII